jgi:NAD(P)H-hydrate epimerase
MKEVPLKQLEILKAIGVRVSANGSQVDFSKYGLLIDALLGYNLRGNPRGEVAKLVVGANASRMPIIALDVPTGLDPNTGNPLEPCIRATETLTLALPKKGLYMKKSAPYVGKLFLADISVPMKLYRDLGLKKAIFYSNPIVELT